MKIQKREAVVIFVKEQMHWSRKNLLNKRGKSSYGWQELRELMDFIYDSKPTCAEQELKGDP